jgi:hypothetical protein
MSYLCYLFLCDCSGVQCLIYVVCFCVSVVVSNVLFMLFVFVKNKQHK